MYCISSIKPWREACSTSGTPEERQKREAYQGRGLFTKSNEKSDKDIYDSLSFLLTHILCIQDTILLVIYVNSTQFCPKLYHNQHANMFCQVSGKCLVACGI